MNQDDDWQLSLPKPPATVLVTDDPDGARTFWLAEHGYYPTLIVESTAALKQIRRAMVALPFVVQNQIVDIRLSSTDPPIGPLDVTLSGLPRSS